MMFFIAEYVLPLGKVARVDEIAVELMIAGAEAVVGRERVVPLAALTPKIIEVHRSNRRIGMVRVNLGILNLQLRQAHTGRHTYSRVEGDREGRIERVAMAVNLVLAFQHCRRGPLLAVTRVSKGDPESVRPDSGRLEGHVESCETFEQHVLVIGGADVKAHRAVTEEIRADCS